MFDCENWRRYWRSGLAPFDRDGVSGGQFSQAPDVIVEGGIELFQNYVQLVGVRSGHRLNTQFTYAIFQATEPGKGRKEAAKQSVSWCRWLLRVHSSPNPARFG
jgi:hypothetical protein